MFGKKTDENHDEDDASWFRFIGWGVVVLAVWGGTSLYRSWTLSGYADDARQVAYERYASIGSVDVIKAFVDANHEDVFDASCHKRGIKRKKTTFNEYEYFDLMDERVELEFNVTIESSYTEEDVAATIAQRNADVAVAQTSRPTGESEQPPPTDQPHVDQPQSDQPHVDQPQSDQSQPPTGTSDETPIATADTPSPPAGFTDADLARVTTAIHQEGGTSANLKNHLDELSQADPAEFESLRKPVSDILFRTLATTTEEHYGQLVTLLTQWHTDKPAVWLAGLPGDANIDMRSRLMKGLGSLPKDPDVQQALVGRLMIEEDRTTAIHVLAKFDPSLEPLILPGITNPSIPLRRSVAELLMHVGTTQALPALRKAIYDSAPGVAVASLDAIRRIAPDQLHPVIAAAVELRSTDVNRQTSALKSLAATKIDEQYREQVLALLRSHHAKVKDDPTMASLVKAAFDHWSG